MRSIVRFLMVNLFLLTVYSASAADILLYDQTGQPPRGNGAPDQNFEAVFDTNDSAIADDFVVTSATGWVVNRLNLTGSYSNNVGPADSVDIEFYPDASGSPDEANPICSFTGLPITVDSSGSFSTDLPGGCILPLGTYWFSHITNMDFGTSGQHFASNTDTVTGNEAHWKNPGDAFGTGCTTFMPAAACGVGGGAPPFDFLFSLEGMVLAQVQSIPTFSLSGLMLLILSLGLFARFRGSFIRK